MASITIFPKDDADKPKKAFMRQRSFIIPNKAPPTPSTSKTVIRAKVS